MRYLAYDIECYSNYFLIVFYDGKKVVHFEHTSLASIKSFVQKTDVLIGYNNFGYDDVMLKLILSGLATSVDALKKINDRIIGSKGRMPEDLFRVQYAPYPWGHSIDMFQIVNKKGGLKEWECRMHYPTVIEAPTDFAKPLPVERMSMVRDYCVNDCKATWALYELYKEQIHLRGTLIDMYDLGTRPYVLGDAGIAQAIFIDKYRQRTGGWSTTARAAAAKSPDNICRAWKTTEIISPRVKFLSEPFQRFFVHFKQQVLVGDSNGGFWSYKDDAFDDPVQLGANLYQIGVGGLHSCDGPGRFIANKEVGIYDLDVASYYPSLIIEEGIYPKHIGPGFLADYREVRDMRLAAKKQGDKAVAEALKIVVNASFGKFNDIYSPIRSIPSALRVTINGQLQLLMLVERLHLAGTRVLSANTDGVTFMWHRSDHHTIDQIITAWQKDTHHQLEETEYNIYARANVNNYCALKLDGKVKTKGSFEQLPLFGKSDERIVKQAAADYLLKGKDIAETVNASNDIRDFVYYQRTKNGGTLYHGASPIGRTARWYANHDGSPVRRLDSDGTYTCLPCGQVAGLILTLPTKIPNDLNRRHYICEAARLVESVTKRAKA